MLGRLSRRFGTVGDARREDLREQVQNLQVEVRDFLAPGLRVPLRGCLEWNGGKDAP